MKPQTTVAAVLHKESYELLSPYIDTYVKEERSGKHIYGSSFEQVGAFLVVEVTPEITGEKLKDPMKIFIPLGCVKFMIEGVGGQVQNLL